MNARADYTSLAEAVGEALEGQSQASQFLERLRNRDASIDGDSLYYELIRSQGTPARARGFSKRIQRELERQGAV